MTAAILGKEFGAFSFGHTGSGVSVRLTERQLIEAAQAGESEAFGRLVLRYQQALLRYLCRMVDRTDVGQDLCQETFIRAWRRLRTFDPARPLAPWLYRIGTNLALNYLQRRSWRFLSFFRQRSDGERLETEPLSDEEPADSMFERYEAVAEVREALARLDPKDRIPLLLYYGEEMTCGEIAMILETSISAAKVRLFRARARLKVQLESASGIGGMTEESRRDTP